MTDKRVAVVGTGERGVGEARFLRSYTADVTLIAPDAAHELDAGQRAGLAESGVDAHQRTSVPGLYAAGDVVHGLDQISHAMGEGGVVSTTIRNDLAKEAPLLRAPVKG